MSEKVKLTREQADIIEKHKTEHLEMLKDMFENPQDYEIGKHEPLLELTAEKYHDALYIGYEIEETFEVGDWVVHSNGNIIRQIEKVERDRVNVTDGEDGYIWGISYIRHATPSEIAEEKQRRWWAKHGREVWKLKRGDVLKSRNIKIMEYVESLDYSDDGEKIVNFSGGNWEYFTDVKRKYDIVCFAEDRKDVDHA